ncbi:MAG: hopanoid biosynthesis-associated RND transporter HpnN [Gammaproteobacteria bacterium HGW-Gammaproteobacteria-10]|nr:MAG: hopanoid biosynthesis-associated RND transporter HpnN [Gammaproteobacteria bacterium HGW-Gammaproteobacteria-10]
MPKPISSSHTHILETLAKLILRFPWLLIFLFVALSATSLTYTLGNLGINNNTAELLSQELPFQKIRLRLEEAFPHDASAIIVIVESDTAEETALAANHILTDLSSRPSVFESAYISDDNPFFRQQGFLFLEFDELEDLSSRLVDAQPFIGHLSKNYHFAGLLEILSLALTESEQDIAMPLAPILTALDETVMAVGKNRHHYLSWQKLLAEDKFGQNPTRRLVIAKPHLDFNDLLPAEQPMQYLRQLAVRMRLQHPGVGLSFTGEVPLEHEEMESVNESMVVSGMVSLLLVCSVLWIGLGSLRLMLSTFVALIVGLILTAGFATVAVGHLNLISVAFAVLYIGLGVDFATHLCLRYQECRRMSMQTDSAILDSLGTVGPSLFLCTLTTVTGFLAFVPTDFKGVSELGIISAGGMLIGLIVSLLLLPALLKILRFKPLEAKQSTKLPEWLYRFPFRHSRSIRIVAILLAIASGFILTQLTFDSNPIHLRDPKTQSVVAFKKLLQSKTESPFIISALTDSLEEADELAEKFSRLSSVHEAITLSNLVPGDQDEKLEIIDTLNLIMPAQLDRFGSDYEPADVRKALVEFSDTLKKAQQKNAASVSTELLDRLDRDIRDFIAHADVSENPESVYARLETSTLILLPETMRLLRDGLTATEFGLDDIPDYVREHWISPNGLVRTLVLPEQDLNDPAHLKVFVNEVLDTYPQVFGLPIGDVTSGQAVVDAFIQAFSSALLFIVVLLLIVTRSLNKTLLIIAPLLLAALLTGAFNVLIDNPFNFANIIVLPLLLGMGVDSGIHIVHRLQQKHGDQEDLLQSSSARGVFFSSLTTLCSFSSLAFTSHLGISSMGLLLSVGITMTLASSLIVLPALINSKKFR